VASAGIVCSHHRRAAHAAGRGIRGVDTARAATLGLRFGAAAEHCAHAAMVGDASIRPGAPPSPRAAGRRTSVAGS
jgi:hypothetical protein